MDNINTPNTPIHKILHCALADDSMKTVTCLNFFGENHIIWVRAIKNLGLPTQLIIFPDFWAKILEIAHPKLFLFTSMKWGNMPRVEVIPIDFISHRTIIKLICLTPAWPFNLAMYYFIGHILSRINLGRIITYPWIIKLDEEKNKNHMHLPSAF